MDTVNTINEKAIVKVEFSGSFLIRVKELMFAKISEYNKSNSESATMKIFDNIKNSKQQDNLDAFNIETLAVIVFAIEQEMEKNNSFEKKSIESIKNEIKSNSNLSE